MLRRRTLEVRYPMVINLSSLLWMAVLQTTSEDGTMKMMDGHQVAALAVSTSWKDGKQLGTRDLCQARPMNRRWIELEPPFPKDADDRLRYCRPDFLHFLTGFIASHLSSGTFVAIWHTSSNISALYHPHSLEKISYYLHDCPCICRNPARHIVFKWRRSYDLIWRKPIWLFIWLMINALQGGTIFETIPKMHTCKRRGLENAYNEPRRDGLAQTAWFVGFPMSYHWWPLRPFPWFLHCSLM